MFNKLQYEQELYFDLVKVPPKKYNLLRKEKASLCSEQQLRLLPETWVYKLFQSELQPVIKIGRIDSRLIRSAAFLCL